MDKIPIKIHINQKNEIDQNTIKENNNVSVNNLDPQTQISFFMKNNIELMKKIAEIGKIWLKNGMKYVPFYNKNKFVEKTKDKSLELGQNNTKIR